MPSRGSARQRRADLIADIYDAALDGDSLSRLAAPFAAALDRRTAFLWIGDAAGRIVDGATHGLSDDAFGRYASYFQKVDIWAAAAVERGVSLQPTLASNLVSERRFLDSEFYFDYAQQHETIDAVGGAIPIGRGRFGVLGVHRLKGTPPFDGRDPDRLGALIPHLQRALQLRGRLVANRLAGIGFAALDALVFAAVVCEADGRVRFANAAAESLARTGTGLVLRDAAGVISAIRPTEGRQLAGLIMNAAHGGAGGGITISNAAGEILLVLVAPLPRRFLDQPWLALVTLRPASARPTVSAVTLAHLFGLTAAEASLALALLAGASLAEVGALRRVTNNTLRTQLAGVLRKTSTRNQQSLVRLLGLLPPLR